MINAIMRLWENLPVGHTQLPPSLEAMNHTMANLEEVVAWAARLKDWQGFISGILAEPGDESLRLIYADYLDEGDFSRAAHWLRLDIDVGQLGCSRMALEEYRDLCLVRDEQVNLLRIFVPQLWKSRWESQGCEVCGGQSEYVNYPRECSRCGHVQPYEMWTDFGNLCSGSGTFPVVSFPERVNDGGSGTVHLTQDLVDDAYLLPTRQDLLRIRVADSMGATLERSFLAAIAETPAPPAARKKRKRKRKRKKKAR